MAIIDPKLLETAPKQSTITRGRSTARGESLSWFVLMKNAFAAVLEKTVLKVQINNEKQLQQGLSRIASLLEQTRSQKNNLDIGRTDTLTTGAVSEFRITNLENLSIDNIEDLASAFNELDPILKNLKVSTQSGKQTVGLLTRLTQQMSAISKDLRQSANNTVKFPETQQVSGEVSITTLPDTQKEVVAALERLEVSLKKIVPIPVKGAQKIVLSEGKELIEKLNELNDNVSKLPGNMEYPSEVRITNFPPTKYPLPVTNININPLRGSIKSRSITVSASMPTPLPDEVLAFRRSMIIFNNSATTVYIGGSDVSSSNGLPILTQTYSPALDAGQKMILYGISASGPANVRVFEASNDNIGQH